MKTIIRMLIFSGVSLYLTSLWNKGFIIPSSTLIFIQAMAAFAVVYYLILPLAKLILLPLNIITLGLASFFVFLFALHLVSSLFGFVTITAWTFQGLSWSGIVIQKTSIGYFWNLVLSSLSLSVIIQVLEKLI